MFFTTTFARQVSNFSFSFPTVEAGVRNVLMRGDIVYHMSKISNAQMGKFVLATFDNPETGECIFGHPVDSSMKQVLRTDTATVEYVPSDFKLSLPVAPAAIHAVGLNYRKHAEETGNPVPAFPTVFYKNCNAVIGPRDKIVIPKCCDANEVDFEAELGVIVGLHRHTNRPCKNVTVEDAMNYVMGYVCVNDVTARKWQGKRGGSQWVYSKSFDTFCPIGPVVVGWGLIKDPNNLKIRSILNGQTMQESNTKDMIFNVAQLISFLSQGTTLELNTLILTGTPEGVGFTRKPPVYLKSGDVIEVEIEGIGKITHAVINEGEEKEEEKEDDDENESDKQP